MKMGFCKTQTWSNDPKRDDLALIVKEMLAEININVGERF